MSCALALITPNTGGEDLVDSQTGFLVPIRSPLEIAEKVNWFADNQSSIADMGKAARKKAKSVSWSRYQDNIIEASAGNVFFYLNEQIFILKFFVRKIIFNIPKY